MRTRLVLVLAVAVLLAGCAQVVDGKESPAPSTGSGSPGVARSIGASSSSSSPDFPSSSPAPGPSTSASTVVKYPRTARQTAIGDPVTADLCAGLPATTFRGLGYVAETSTLTYPPNCIVRLTKGGVGAFDVSAYVTLGNTARAARGRKATTLSGLRTYTYPVLAALGDCEHDIVTTGITVAVQTYAIGKKIPKTQCAATTRAAASVAATIARHAVPRIPLADPSITAIDFCAVLEATAFRSLPSFSTGTVAVDDATAGCRVVRGERYLYLDNAVGTQRPPTSRLAKVGGHAVYSGDSNTASDCTFTVVQGRTSNGRYEQVRVSALDAPKGGSRTLCTDAEKLMVEFLDRAGLT